MFNAISNLICFKTKPFMKKFILHFIFVQEIAFGCIIYGKDSFEISKILAIDLKVISLGH